MGSSKRYYTSEELGAEFDKMSKDEKIKVLYEAIGIMQQYNGRSRVLCIAMAMGYSNHEGENDTYERVY